MASAEDNHERSAAGMDYDFPMKEKASKLGSTLAESARALRAAGAPEVRAAVVAATRLRMNPPRRRVRGLA